MKAENFDLIESFLNWKFFLEFLLYKELQSINFLLLVVQTFDSVYLGVEIQISPSAAMKNIRLTYENFSFLSLLKRLRFNSAEFNIYIFVN